MDLKHAYIFELFRHSLFVCAFIYSLKSFVAFQCESIIPVNECLSSCSTVSAAKQRNPKYQVVSDSLQDSLVAFGPTKHSAKASCEQESNSDVIYPLHREENNETFEHSVSVNIDKSTLEDNANTFECNANTLEGNDNTFEVNAKLSPADMNVIMSESDCEGKCENEDIGDEDVSNIGKAYSPAMDDVSCAEKLLSQTAQTQVENHGETFYLCLS